MSRNPMKEVLESVFSYENNKNYKKNKNKDKNALDSSKFKKKKKKKKFVFSPRSTKKITPFREPPSVE